MAYTNIDDPSAYFQTAIYTGAGANQTVTNDGNSDLQPDFLWIKRRNAGYGHVVVDSNRGLGSSNPPYLATENTDAENSNQNWISGVGTDSFTIGINEQNLSNTSGTYVAWQWKANGGTTSSNTDGNITSTVQANTTAGFSIVTWTGNEQSAASVGHGLGVIPEMVFFKRRNATYNWVVYLGALGQVSGNWLNAYLNLTNAAEQNASIDFTSTLLKPGSGATTNSGDMIAYCFNSVQGYSKFGKYVGNGSTDGPFIYTGFKPAFFLLKKTSGADGWRLFDNKRAGYNDDNYRLAPNASAAEDTATTYLDILSNGVKIRGTAGSFNQSGGTFIYMAFAENPFTTSTGIPTTAR